MSATDLVSLVGAVVVDVLTIADSCNFRYPRDRVIGCARALLGTLQEGMADPLPMIAIATDCQLGPADPVGWCIVDKTWQESDEKVTTTDHARHTIELLGR